MPVQPSLSQITFSTAILASAAGCIASLSPPNPTAPANLPSDTPLIEKTRITTTQGTFNTLIFGPYSFLALHTVGLALTYPSIPRWLLPRGSAENLNPDLISWSKHTAIPIALILGVGMPLRLVAYRTLGRSFTFSLAPPKDGLVTTGVYKWVQHPSYTGAAVIFVAPMVLWYRAGGAMGCWMSGGVARVVERGVVPVAAGVLLWMLGMRTRDEERMLRGVFGEEWEVWHKKTARFLPWLF
ncbi:hypothetical protein B0T16DRAFT_408438 [Cercophora newfieldiana]|uniref:Protein-S-isoprenylcysteine O-methyltransferase n=1 Tax=Cercophora newfieldiana TaxID=92897 RepID=A0AA40CTB3_9PEZI|nr:hypothetical protein B0T16DRAFT_408438 [Cercophora newfieldiana]